MRQQDYIVEKELHRGAETVLQTARPGDRAERGRYVLRRFTPHDARQRPDEARAQCEAFIATGRLQRKTAELCARHWVDVRDSDWWDRDNMEACVVSEYHPFSLRKIIDGRVKIDGTRLFAIVRGLLHGIAAWERTAGRPHGDLAPEHVLFASARRLDRPLLTGPDHRAPEKRSDWNDLGKLIYETVCFRPYTRSVGWPLRSAPEWPRLGRRGEAWRDFCSRLLNPGIQAQTEDILRGLQALKEPAGQRVRLAFGLGAPLGGGATLPLLAILPVSREWRGIRSLRTLASQWTTRQTTAQDAAELDRPILPVETAWRDPAPPAVAIVPADHDAGAHSAPAPTTTPTTAPMPAPTPATPAPAEIDEPRPANRPATIAQETRLALTGSQAIAHVWQRHIARLNRQTATEAERAERVERLRRFLDDLDWHIPVNPAPGDDLSAAEPSPKANAALWSQRETLLQTLLDRALAEETAATPSAAEFLRTDFAVAALRDFERQRRAAGAESRTGK
jgi:hypothetical protein